MNTDWRRLMAISRVLRGEKEVYYEASVIFSLAFLSLLFQMQAKEGSFAPRFLATGLHLELCNYVSDN